MDRQERRKVRRETIAHATWAVLMREGVRGASVRAVLAEAQMTSGAMRYYFRNHDELLLFAAEHVLDQATARIQQRLADTSLTGKERVKAVIGEILPLDPTRETEITVFARLAEVDDAEGRGTRTRNAAYQGCRRLAEFAVVELVSAHGVELQVEPTDRAHQRLVERFHLALDGLAYQSVLNPGLLSYQDVADLLDRLVDHLELEVAQLVAGGEAEGS